MPVTMTGITVYGDVALTDNNHSTSPNNLDVGGAFHYTAIATYSDSSTGDITAACDWYTTWELNQKLGGTSIPESNPAVKHQHNIPPVSSGINPKTGLVLGLNEFLGLRTGSDGSAIAVFHYGLVDQMEGSLSFSVVPAIASFTPASAPVGSVILLTGKGFTGVNQILFTGSGPASFVIDNDSLIELTVQTGASLGKISIQTSAAGGCTLTNFDAMSITSISPTHGLAGQALTITGVGFASIDHIEFASAGGGIITQSLFTLVNSTTITTFVPSGAVTGHVNVLNTVSVGVTALNLGPVFTVDGPPAGTTLLGSFTSAPIATPISAANAFYGTETQCLTDTRAIDYLLTNPVQIIGERIARRWQTPRGALAIINDDPGGWDCRQYVNKKMGPGEIATAQAALASEAIKDEEVSSATVSMTLVNNALTISGALVSAAGPFTLTLSVGALTTSLVFSQ